jgi:predicted metal-binding membrane protein
MSVLANGRRGDTAKGSGKRVSDLCPILLNPGFWLPTPHSNSRNSVNHFLTSGDMASERASQRAFSGALTLIFAISVVVTIVWCRSMSAMGEMPMLGGWTMSMAWMRMPGQTWLGTGVSFLGMWVVMMVAMMLPCLIPTLWRYRQALAGKGETHPGWLTALVGGGYFFVWTVFGIVIFPVGVALAELEMQLPTLSRAVPLAVAVVVLIAGAFQFTPWKRNHLACCRDTPERRCKLERGGGAALRQGVRLGLNCCYCCAGLMTILLVLGIMDLRTMALVTVAITAERLAPAGDIVARVIGAVVIGMGLFLAARVAGFC